MKTALPIAALCLSLVGCAPITPPPRGERIVRDIVYSRPRTGAEHLDIYLPAGRGPFPLVVWYHGGGWKYGDKGWMLYLRRLTRRGYAVASVQYRLSGTAKYPAQLDDSRAALHWLEANSTRFNLDRHNINLAGASAGAHLAAMVGEMEPANSIRAICLLYPPTDLDGFPNQGATRGYLPELFGGEVALHHDLARSASPVNHVSHSDPPFLIFHGDGDTLVPLQQSRLLNARLRAAGVECQLIVMHGQGHGFALTDAQLDQVAAFLRQHHSP